MAFLSDLSRCLW